jgi:hypothetical protein
MATTEAGGKTRNNRNNKNGDENQGGNKSKVMRLDRVERLNLTLSAGAVAASLALTTPHFTASLAVGAALEAANFRALRDTGKRLVSGELVAAGPKKLSSRYLRQRCISKSSMYQKWDTTPLLALPPLSCSLSPGMHSKYRLTARK